jgi:hypothetical protein
MNSKGIIAIVVGVALLVLVRWEVSRWGENRRVEARAAQALLVQDTIEAARDTSRALSIEGVLGDSLRATQRRAIQVEQRADKLDATLKLERMAREQLEVSMVALRATVTSDTTVDDTRGVGVRRSTGDSVRHAAFDLRQAPYTVHADVALPEPPKPGSMDVRVTLDSLGLDLRVSCSREHPEGVREAFVTVLGPEWASVRLGRVEQSPDDHAQGPMGWPPKFLGSVRSQRRLRSGENVKWGRFRWTRADRRVQGLAVTTRKPACRLGRWAGFFVPVDLLLCESARRLTSKST